MLDEADHVRQLDQLGVGRGQRRREKRRRAVPRRAQRPRAAERDRHRSSTGRPAISSPARKLRGSNGCSGWRTRTCSRAAGASGPVPVRNRPVDDVEQLGDGHRGRTLEVRALVVAGVGDDQPLGRGEQRVEQHLPILGARVAVADVGIVEQQVVAVARGLARELAVVEPEDADDAVRDRAHRHERADRQVAGAEVRPRRASLQAVGEQRADVGELELGRRDRRSAVRRSRRARTSSRIRPSSARCQDSRSRRRGERVRGVGDRRHPGVDRLRPAERVDGVLDAVDEFGHPPRELDRAALDVVEREHPADERAILLGHRDAEQDPVEPGPPRVAGNDVELERGAVALVEAPADAAVDDPFLHPR